MLAAVLLVLCAHGVFILFSGKGILSENPYNSYTLQACAWLQGSLDLGENFPWLELAVHGGKYYVSFPPFPSYVLLPFAALFGEQAPDGIAALLVLLVGVCYAVELARLSGAGERSAVLLAVFLYCANNLWQVTVDGWVWFFAQNLSFTLTLMAFVHGMRGQKGRALFFLCAAVGCRPFQILYLPVVCWLLLRSLQEKAGRWKWLFWEKNIRLLPAMILAASFMALNLARFGNPFEFGHSYLPEFTRSEYGQFSLHYLGENLLSLVRLPSYDPELERLVFPAHNGCSIFLVFPIFWLYFWALWQRLRQGGKKERLDVLSLLALLLIHIFLLCLHRTMGGAHFGNRYIIDTVPTVYLFLCGAAARWETYRTERERGFCPVELCFSALFLLGLLINFTGVLGFYGSA